jgi:hypothetical protein
VVDVIHGGKDSAPEPNSAVCATDAGAAPTMAELAVEASSSQT